MRLVTHGLWLLVAATAPRPSVIRFDGDDIDGRLQHPEGEWMAGRRTRVEPPLSKPPASFAAEERRTLLEAADAMARGNRGAR